MGGPLDGSRRPGRCSTRWARARSTWAATGSGCQAKLVFNMVIAGTVQAFAEALAMGRAAGLPPATLVEVIMSGRARSGIIDESGADDCA